MRHLLAGLLLPLALLVGVSPAAAAAEDPVSSTLAVFGQGEAQLAPDLGSFEAVVERTAPTSAGVRKAANRRLQAIVRRLQALGVRRADITTTSIRLVRERTRSPRTRAIRVRYRATGSFGVRVEGAERLGRALGAVADAGATGIDGPEFSFSNALSTQGRQEAERAALADARGRADEAAASQGQKVVGVRSIDLDPSSSGAGGGESTPTPSLDRTSEAPVLPGRQSFSSAVRVVYLIGPAG